MILSIIQFLAGLLIQNRVDDIKAVKRFRLEKEVILG
jgi:hypothetical protein